MVNTKKLNNLNLDTLNILKTLCSNFRGNKNVTAEFRCSVYYGLKKFLREVEKSLTILEKENFILSFYIGEQEFDEDNDIYYINISANLNLSVEEMSEIAVNSQTVYFK